MDAIPGHILIVDDTEFNRKMLGSLMAKHSHTFDMAENGAQALEKMRERAYDVVLLDVVMPVMDGYETLQHLKRDEALRHIPVIMVTAVDEMDSVVRCITMGAADYLPKPFNASLLNARINSSLASKRLRDLELEYLEQVGYVTEAAANIETGQFKEETLDKVAARPDALGRLAKVFQRMAREVHAREQRLKQQLAQLKCDMEDHLQAVNDTPSAYVPMDRRHALAHQHSLPDRATGAALFADISGFTALTESLAHELGFQRGAEEITRQLNRIYDALIKEVHLFGGSVITFGGDAITCWFDDQIASGTLRSAPARAGAAAVAMQKAMGAFAAIQTPAGQTLSLGLKVAVACGQVRRFLAGDPAVQNQDILAGGLLDELSQAEQQAKRGEVLFSEPMAAALEESLTVAQWRLGAADNRRFAVVGQLADLAQPSPWPALEPIADEMAKPWLLPAVYDKVFHGESEFLSELRPAAALLVQFSGIHYDSDDHAGEKLDAFIRFAQTVAGRHDGAVEQISMGDKGSSLCIIFGAPTAHPDDAARAIKTAWQLCNLPPDLPFIRNLRMGIAHGPMRAGAYGSRAQRAYGVIGDPINLAARLMTANQADNQCCILCDANIHQLAQGVAEFEALAPIQVKGKAAPVPVYRPTALKGGVNLIDQLPVTLQLTLKVASLLGEAFSVALLQHVYPVAAEQANLPRHLNQLAELHLLRLGQNIKSAKDITDGALCHFPDSAVRGSAYGLMLFAQRRQLHRVAAEWLEAHPPAEPSAAHHVALARHWKGAEDPAKAIGHLEKAGALARQKGALAEAQAYLKESLALEEQVKSAREE